MSYNPSAERKSRCKKIVTLMVMASCWLYCGKAGEVPGKAEAAGASKAAVTGVEVVHALEKRQTKSTGSLVRRSSKGDVVWICLNSGEANDAYVKAVASLPTLEGMVIKCALERRLSPDSIRALHSASGLRSLSLSRSSARLSPEWAAAIGGLSHLHELQLCYMEIEPGAGSELAKLQKLQKLDVSNCRGVSSNLLQAISVIPGLEQLNLSNTAISDESLGVLRGCPRLQSLDLSNTTIREKGLRELLNCTGLRAVRLVNVSVPAAVRQSFNGSQIQIVRQLPEWDYSFALCRGGEEGPKPHEK